MKAVHFGAPNAERELIERLLMDSGYDVVFAEESTDIGRVADEVANADLVTTAVGLWALLTVAVPLARGLQQRVDLDLDAQFPPLVVVACENAASAAADLEAEVRAMLPESAADALESFARFTSAVVDPAASRWLIDRTPFDGEEPSITAAEWVDALDRR